MKFGSDKIKYPGRIFALIFLCAALILLYFLVAADKDPAVTAEELMAEGRYTEAAQLYLEAGDSEMYQRCLMLYTEQIYLRGINRLQMGDYSEAIELFAAIAEYKNSAELIRSCRYLWAVELEAAGDYAGARELCQSLEDYPGRDVLIEKCNEGMLRQACSHALDGEYGKAAEVLRDRGDKEALISQAERMERWLEGEERILSDEKKFLNSYYENVYVNELAYVVVPEECSIDCRFLLYFPGGKDDEINIDFLYYYLMNPAPNTIAVFLRTNGIYDIAAKSREAFDIMEKAAAECGVFIREIVSCGSSLGAYPAMQSAVYIPQQSGVPVPCVLSLDAGDDWKSPYTLSRSQCHETAEAGTEFYLFESPWVGMDRAAIRLMVETGNNVTLVGCTYDEHVRITLDAMGMGVLHWALGDRTKPCELDIYSFARLHA